ncbi:MAG TPA: type II secretion system ATPase GspE [Myxococcales bacterium]|nr:type II secretion system ATPase GspE [Myxococcales bacterium]
MAGMLETESAPQTVDGPAAPVEPVVRPESTVQVSHGPAFLCGRPLGQILKETAGLSEEKLAEALAQQAEKGGRLGEILVGLKVLGEEEVLRALAIQLDLPFSAKLSIDEITPDLIEKLPINFAKQAKLLPLRQEGGAIVLATGDPLDTALLDEARLLLEISVVPHVAPPQAILDAINKVYDRAANEAQRLMDDLATEDLDSLAHELEEPQDLLDAGDDEAPIIKLVNSLLFQAAKERASDIHIEPFERDLSVRFRVDGVLREKIRPPKRFQKAIASRVKIMGSLNIAETRLPQDGRIRIKLAGRDIDIRLSTVPTTHGERIVMRLLDKSAVLLDLASLGFNPSQLEAMDSMIHRSHGIFLVTGPTGSGKSTTLYAALSKINTPELNILTVEDPVEIQLKGIGQVQVNPKIDLTFASGLRSFLRQDPDVIMVGEIRDLETAEIAIQASLTGHLVFSTVHTNDAPGAVTRLIDMGVEPFLVASSLMGCLAQRLVRVVCKECREPYLPSAEELAEIGLPPTALQDSGVAHVYRERGCSTCNDTGYKGRIGIYEMMLVTDDIRQQILKKVDSGTIKKTAISQGLRTLLQDGALKVLKGATTIPELLSVTQEDIV